MRSRSILLSLALPALARASLAGQIRADPRTVINGRVAVRVYIVLSNADAQYEAIRGMQLRFFGTTADTAVVVRTDDAGAATALLRPGEYHLVSSSPVNWQGARYWWDRLLQVRPGIAAIELGANSAARSEVVDEAAAAAMGAPPATRVADATLVRKFQVWPRCARSSRQAAGIAMPRTAGRGGVAGALGRGAGSDGQLALVRER